MVSLSEIKNDLEELKNLVDNCQTFDDLRELQQRLDCELEINGDDYRNYDVSDSIDFVRIGSYKCLEYVYFHDWKELPTGKLSVSPSYESIMFDVYDNEEQQITLTDVTPNNLEKAYNAYYQPEGYDKYTVSSYYDKACSGLEADLKTADWDEVMEFTHGKAMSGNYVVIRNTESGKEITVAPDQYREKFEANFPYSPSDFEKAKTHKKSAIERD